MQQLPSFCSLAIVAPLALAGSVASSRAAEAPAASNSPSADKPMPAATPSPAASATAAAKLALDVILVNDPDFPPVSEKDAAAILEEARETVADKLGFAGLSFRLLGSTSTRAFLDEHAPLHSPCLASFEAVRVRPSGRRARDVPLSSVVQFLSRWKVEELRAFFPEGDRKRLADYETIGKRLLEEFDRKIDLISSFTEKDGASLLAPERIDERSYVRWVCAMRDQDEADLVLTNAFILYDLGSEPYPHSIFQKCKVGGASLLSPKRHAMRGRAMVSSTFSMMTDIPFFQEDGLETLLPRERFDVIGAFIVAHELGHALFKLPDFYDHPKECLMTTKYETGYVSGYWYLKASPGACPACAPWVAAKSHVFLADSARAAADYQSAIDELKEAIRATPKHIDGSYKRYLADLSSEVADLYVAKGDVAEARRWIGSVLRIVPDHEAALALAARLDSQEKAPASKDSHGE
jgi:tetratricopeptide (TPR) repeat protein